MSRFSTVYDRLIVVLDSLMSSTSGYYRIPNVDDLKDNQVGFLRKGYGLRYNGAAPEEGEFHTFVNNHNMSVVLSREVVKLDGQVEAFDTGVRNLLEDAYTVQKDFLNADQIGEETSIRLIKFESISGVKNVIAGKGNFKTIDVNFNVLISEDI